MPTTTRTACTYDTFLCHNSRDKPFVRKIAAILKKKRIKPWLDEWELPPGSVWQRHIEQCIGSIRSAIVFVGSNGTGPWQAFEIEALLREFADRGCPIILVLLPNARRRPKLPLFLKGFTWVDFRESTPDPILRLVWGITGERPKVM